MCEYFPGKSSGSKIEIYLPPGQSKAARRKFLIHRSLTAAALPGTYIPIRSKSSKETVRVISFFGLGYFTSTARLDWL